MGVYYKYVNLDRREQLDLSNVGGGGIKWGAAFGGLGPHLLAYLLYTSWSGDRVEVCSDNTDQYYDSEEWPCVGKRTEKDFFERGYAIFCEPRK